MAVFTIITRKVALKQIWKAPKRVQKRFALLLSEMAEAGPYRANWPNYSPIGDNRYHCHLGFSWVACWTYSKETVTIEVYYAGSRESAPY